MAEAGGRKLRDKKAYGEAKDINRKVQRCKVQCGIGRKNRGHT